MSLITWNNNYSLGINEIDSQHRELVRIINTLHDAMSKGSAKNVLGDIIKKLINYTTSHFKTEEKYFDQFHYPKTLQHKKEHQEFVAKMVNFQNDFDSGKLTLSLEVMTFLKNWLTEHIKGKDAEYVPFLKEKGL